jgi:hypothetical protein
MKEIDKKICNYSSLKLVNSSTSLDSISITTKEIENIKLNNKVYATAKIQSHIRLFAVNSKTEYTHTEINKP